MTVVVNVVIIIWLSCLTRFSTAAVFFKKNMRYCFRNISRAHTTKNKRSRKENAKKRKTKGFQHLPRPRNAQTERYLR